MIKSIEQKIKKCCKDGKQTRKQYEKQVNAFKKTREQIYRPNNIPRIQTQKTTNINCTAAKQAYCANSRRRKFFASFFNYKLMNNIKRKHSYNYAQNDADADINKPKPDGNIHSICGRSIVIFSGKKVQLADVDKVCYYIWSVREK